MAQTQQDLALKLKAQQLTHAQQEEEALKAQQTAEAQAIIADLKPRAL